MRQELRSHVYWVSGEVLWGLGPTVKLLWPRKVWTPSEIDWVRDTTTPIFYTAPTDGQIPCRIEVRLLHGSFQKSLESFLESLQKGIMDLEEIKSELETACGECKGILQDASSSAGIQQQTA